MIVTIDNGERVYRLTPNRRYVIRDGRLKLHSLRSGGFMSRLKIKRLILTNKIKILALQLEIGRLYFISIIRYYLR